MSFAEFSLSVRTAKAAPESLGTALQALWWEARGDWTKAHTLVQRTEGAGEEAEGSWVHAYLHRKNGETGNADYWYARAGRRRPAVTLQREWQDIATVLLGG